MAFDTFFPWFELTLGNADLSGSGLGGFGGGLAGAVPINRRYFEADIKVEMRYAMSSGNRFEITIAGLPAPLYKAIKTNKDDASTIEIKLGYYTGEKATVLQGTIESKEAKAGDCLHETTLKGVETAFYKLRKTCLTHEEVFGPNTRMRQIVEAVGQRAGVERDIGGAILLPTDDIELERDLSLDRKQALDALVNLTQRIHMEDHFSLQIDRNKIRYYKGTPVLVDAGQLIPPPAIFSGDNVVIKAKAFHQRPRGAAQVCPTPAADSLENLMGFDFEMLGDPRLRPGGSFTLKSKVKDEVVVKQVVIESITHSFTREKGYTVKGRALLDTLFLEHVFSVMAPGPDAINDDLQAAAARRAENAPAVNVAEVLTYTQQEHLANTKVITDVQPTITSPSIQASQDSEGFNLQRRPLAAPFAWNLCGLIVPVYPGMRAVATHNRYLREDAILNGFVWTTAMTPPPNEVGDYWLCLPVDPPSDRAPNNSDKAANDLTDASGKRIIQLKGMTIAIGQGLLPNLGTRPSTGTDNELTITAGSSTNFTLKDGEVKIEAGGRTITVGNGTVNVT